MTQIYVNRHPHEKNRMVPLAILFVLIAVISFGLWKRSAPHPGETTGDAAPKEQPGSKILPADMDILPGMAEINALLLAGELGEARDKAFVRLRGVRTPLEIREVEKFLGDLHMRMVFSQAPMEEKINHVIKAGDTLGELAQTYGSTPELISEMNNIKNNIIRVGKSLQILSGTFSATVDKSNNEMELRLNDRFFKRYLVGTGTDSSTPVGEYRITLRLRHPVWYRPDGESFPYGHPENLLGTHYLKLNTPGIGLHGTWQPESVGSQSSAGCVRFKNEMIEELYKILPEGTTVTIID